MKFEAVRYPQHTEPAYTVGRLSQQEYGFVREHPGFFTRYWYPLLYLFLLGTAPFVALLLALVGTYKNGYAYPTRYGIYAPFFFWASLVFCLLPLILLTLTMPV